MSQLLLHNARLILPDGIQHGGVFIRDGRIAQVFSGEQTPAGFSAAETIDLQGARLACRGGYDQPEEGWNQRSGYASGS